MGKYGVYALATIVILACVTTALGLSSIVGDYFEELTHGKLKYKQIVIALIAISYAMSNFGLSQIIAIAGPVLNILYPPLIVLVLGAYVEKITDNDHVICVGTYMALITSILSTISTSGHPIAFIDNLPFASFGLGWVIPALIGCGLGGFWKKDAALFSGKELKAGKKLEAE